MHTFMNKYHNRIAFAAPDEGEGGGDEGNQDEGGESAAEGDAQEGSKFAQGLLNQGDKGDAQEGDAQEGEKDDNADPEPKEEAQPDADRPENVPEKFWDAEKKAIKSDEMAKAYADLEKAHGKLRRDKGIKDAPEDVAEYFTEALELDDDSPFNVGVDDPGLKSWAEVAKKWNVDVDTARGLAKDWMKEMAPHAPEPVDPEAENAKLGKNAENVKEGIFTWLESNEEHFDDEDVAEISKLSQTAAGIRLLGKMRNFAGAEPIPVASSGGSSMSAVDWHKQMGDAIEAKDYSKQAELDKKAEQLWPDGIPRAGVPETISNAERARRKS